ncbi:MAG: PEP-CTERM sorting domain-containing protein [Verrucomicrobia bacterium]|nr:PEP-CTERM sorting domain-containing protein [Verrucomicrobiota bacterium]MCH8526032.1 PEP-CTERM sorting domain-containing protein [Kiritimatiellia bacterium]
MKTKTIPFLLTSLLTAGAAHAAILFSGSYTQDFDSLATASTNIRFTDSNAPAWENNSTLPGWYAGGNQPLNENYAVFNGGDGTSGLNGEVGVGSFGSFDSTDRAIAPLKRNNSSVIALALTNDTAGVLSSFTVTYTGEQWRDNATGTPRLDFTYQVDPDEIWGTGSWTSVSALDFHGPQNAGTGILDGNTSANRTVLNAVIPDLALAPGETVWLRWQFVGNNGSYVAVDDLSVTAIPEPGTLALFGIALGALVLFRRRR